MYQFVPMDQIFQASVRGFWGSHIPTGLTWPGQKTALTKSLPSFPIFCGLWWYPQEEKMALFLSLVWISSTLVSPNMGSERPKEAPCFTEQLSMDLGCPYLCGGQKAVFAGRHSRITSIVTSVNPFISPKWEDFDQCGRDKNSEHHAP